MQWSQIKRRWRSTYWSLKDIIAPDIVSTQIKYREILVKYLQTRPRWLDLGCGHQFLPDWAWVPDLELLRSLPRIVGVDYDFESLRQNTLLAHRVVRSDISALPFQAGAFDLVTANMVMEHVHEPERILNEVRRVLAPGGLFILHTPNRSSPLISVAACIPQGPKNRMIKFLEGRREEDVFPTVYKMNTVQAIRRIGAETGFHVESSELLATEAATFVLGPLSIFELLYIRMTQLKPFANLRPDIIAVLRVADGVPGGKTAVADRIPAPR